MKLPNGVSFEEKNLNSRDLTINPNAQRGLNMRRVREIVKDFDPLLVNPIKVSFRNGRYYIIDGQHTLTALRVVNKGDCTVRCKVYYGLTETDEANLFIQQNGHSAPVTTAEKLKVLYLQGDKDVLEFVRTTESVGISVGFNRGSARNRIAAVAAAYSIYKKLPYHLYIETLTLILDAWNGDHTSLQREILQGVSHVVEVYHGEFKPQEMAKRLSKVPPAQIVREGRGIGSGSARIMYAKAILRIYNTGRTTHRLDETRL